MENYIDSGLGNYTIFNNEDIEVESKHNHQFRGFWKMSFDGSSSKF